MGNLTQVVTFIQEQFGTKEFIPLHEPRFWGNEREYVLETIDSTFVSSVGAYVDRFERMMESITGANKAIAVVNGTSALQVALKLIGVKQDDEVIMQALTFVATANAVTYNGASPLFLDVDLDTMGLSPSAISDFLNAHGDLREDGCYNRLTGKRIAACLPMHTFGFPVHLNELQAVCEKWHIPIVEDAAESLGSYYHGKHTGSFGSTGIFSFNGNKTITCGGGGAIVTNDKALGDKAKHLTTTAKMPHPYEFYHDEVGYNFRMPNINAALACAQLEQLREFVNRKRALASKYLSFFGQVGIKFRTELPNTRANYWLMCVEMANREERDEFLSFTNSNHVMTRPIWQLMFRLPMYKNCFKDEQTNAMFLEERIVNIPSSVI